MADRGLVLGLIAARAGSKGIPGKNLLKINGKELVRIAAEVGRQVEELDLLICSTDGEEIAEVARDAGAAVPFLRPVELAGDRTPMLPVMEHAILEVERIYETAVDCVVILDPTAPMRTPKDVSDVIAFFQRENPDLVVSVNAGHYNPYFNILEEESGFFRLCKGSEMNYGSRQAAPPVFMVNTLVWIYSRAAVMEERVRIPGRTLVYEFPEDRAVDLDTPHDLQRLEYFLASSENQKDELSAR